MNMLGVDLSLPFSALLIIAGAVLGWRARDYNDRGFTGDVDRTTPDIQAFEQRNQRST